MKEALHKEVGKLLQGRVSLDEFVRWHAINGYRLPSSEVNSTLRQFSDGLIGVDGVYIALSRWYRYDAAESTNSIAQPQLVAA